MILIPKTVYAQYFNFMKKHEVDTSCHQEEPKSPLDF